MKKVTSFLVLAAALLVAGNAHAQLGINIGYAPETITTTAKNGNSNLPMTGFFAGKNLEKHCCSLCLRSDKCYLIFSSYSKGDIIQKLNSIYCL